MILGLTIPQFTTLHVALSLIGIVTGLIALPAYAAGRWMPRMMALFLVTTLATTLTGFLFPIGNFTPALGVGIISTLVLAIALVALYGYGLNGRARIIYDHRHDQPLSQYVCVDRSGLSQGRNTQQPGTERQ